MTAETLLRSDEEAAALGLVAAIRADAERAAAPQVIELVSVSIDMSGLKGEGAFQYETRMDRKTRTLIFIAGTARRSGTIVMTATAVYKIAGDAD